MLAKDLTSPNWRPYVRVQDVMIAATALTLGVDLVTRNTADLDRLGVELLQR
jgi:predicted nucleic acid-binding protein